MRRSTPSIRGVVPRDVTDPFVVTTRGQLRQLATATGGTSQDDGERLDDYLTRIPPP